MKCLKWLFLLPMQWFSSKKFRISVYKLLKILNMIVLAMLTILFLFSTLINKKIVIKMQDHPFKPIQNFWGKPNFPERALFLCEMVGLTSFGLDKGVSIVIVIISIKSFLSNFFTVSFEELLKGTTLSITSI